MRTLPPLTAAALFLLTLAPRPAPAQDGDESKQTIPGLPSRYVDCLQVQTIDALLSAPATQWGLSEELGKNAYDRLYGIQLCRGFSDDTTNHCRTLANVPGRKDRTMVTKELGRFCATDVEFFRTHAALTAGDQAGVESHCRRWCDLEAGKAREKVDCDGFCRQVIPLMPDKGTEACKAWVERLARKDAANAEDVRDSLPECLMMLAPSPANCTDKFGPAAQRDCRERHSVLAAVRAKDPKGCPKSLRYAAVCAALLAPPGKEQGIPCLKAARSFTQPFCDERRRSGGLRDDTKLPGDPDEKADW